MNPYLMLGSAFGTAEATSLSARLSTWHDAMVAHERRLRSGTTSDGCDDECPHAEARILWSETVATFGPRAHELTFLRSRAKASVPRPTAGAAERESTLKAADIGTRSSPERERQRPRALAASSDGTRRAVEL